MLYKALGIIVAGVLLSCSPIHLEDDLKNQSKFEVLSLQQEESDFINIDFSDMEVFQLDIQKMKFAESERMRDRKAFDPFLQDYLETRQKVQDFDILYGDFKTKPQLRESQTALKRVLAFYVKHRDGSI